VLTYKKNPYLYIPISYIAGSSVIRVHVLDQKGKPVHRIKDKDDPAAVAVKANILNDDGSFTDMTESLLDSGIFWNYIDYNITGKGFLLEFKLKTLKTCEIYCKYDTFPDEDNYDMYVKTKGRSRIIIREPLNLGVTFNDQKVKISISNANKDRIRPIVVTTSFEGNTVLCLNLLPKYRVMAMVFNATFFFFKLSQSSLVVMLYMQNIKPHTSNVLYKLRLPWLKKTQVWGYGV